MGKRSVRFLNDRTGQAASLTAATVTVTPCRKGSVLEAGRVGCNLSSFSNNEPLVMCHWAKSSPYMFSSHVNSPIRKKAAKAKLKGACNVAPLKEFWSKVLTISFRMDRVIGQRSRG